MNNLKQFFRENLEIDAFLVSKPENIFYLTDFQGSFGYFIALKTGEKFLITDSRYAEVAEKLAKKGGFEFMLFDKSFKKEILKQIPNDKKIKIAVENSITLAQKDYWQEIFPKVTIKPEDKIIEKWRAKKNANGLQKVKKACNKLNQVFDDVDFFRGILVEGVTEKEAAFQLEIKLRENGKYELSFPIIVAFGENSAIPHHSPFDRKLQMDENILIDCGVKFENYCSDMTRNLFLGSPLKDYCKSFATLLSAQKKTIQKFQIGKTLSSAEKFCKKELGNSAKFFTHSLGHGIGLEVHEQPSFADKEKAIFAENQVITCEPGLYFPRKFGIRIEDQLLITANGPEILTKTSKELIIL